VISIVVSPACRTPPMSHSAELHPRRASPGTGPWGARPSWPSTSAEEWRRDFWRRDRVAATETLPLGPVSCVRTSAMARLEAVLLVTNSALPARKLAQLASLADATEARTLIAVLNAAYDQDGTAFRVERVAAGFRMFTRPDYALWLGKLHQREAELTLSPPALETLTVVAYRQPLTRADIEAIRGVQCSEMLKQLMDRGLVRIAGEDDSLGRPFLYETTRKFLEVFGLRDLDELPLAEKLRKPAAGPAAATQKAG
jgi:segregation and condensation protein B